MTGLPNKRMQLTKAARCAPFPFRYWGQSLKAAFAADPQCCAGLSRRAGQLSGAVVILITMAGSGCMSGGGIKGVVQDAQKRALAGASVTWTHGTEVSMATTAEDGSFQVTLGTIGPFSSGVLSVSLKGYRGTREEVGGGPWDCTVTLQLEGATAAPGNQCKYLE